MAFIIDRTFVRPNTSTAWPWSSIDSTLISQLNAAKATYNVTTTSTEAADGLSCVYTDSCPSYSDYYDYFTETRSIWSSVNLTSNIENDNIVLTYNIVENT
jgi:hypothetical protein